MTATRVFLVLFSLLSLVFCIAGQVCTPETLGASGVIGETAGTYNAAGTLGTVAGVHIERSSTGKGKLWVVSTSLNSAFRYVSAFDFVSATAAEFTIGPAAGGAANLLGPTFITTDFAGTCYLSDSMNNRVLMYATCSTQTTAYTTAAGVLGQGGLLVTDVAAAGTAGTLTNPAGIAIDSVAGAVAATNPVFVASTGLHSIVKFVPTGPATNTAAGTDVVTAGAGAAGTGSTTAPAGLDSPRGVAYDKSGDSIYIADTNNNRILVVSGASAITTATTTTGVALGVFGVCATQFTAPTGVAIDYTTTPGKTLYVADQGDFRVVYISAAAAAFTAADAIDTPQMFPFSATLTCAGTGTGRNLIGATGPFDVDVVPSAQAPTTGGPGSLVLSDPSNQRVLKLCTASLTVSATISMSFPFSLSVSITLAAAGVSPSFSNTVGGAAAIASLSVSQSLSVSVGNTQAVSGAAASVAISTSSSISVAAPASASSSYSITVSLTTSITTSLTTSITTSVTVTNSYTPSVTNSVTNSYSPSVTNSNTGSYSITTSNSHSISITRSVRLCGNGIINGNEKCDEGVLNGQKSSCCRRNCRFKYGGRICSPPPNTQCFGKGRCDHFGKCAGRKIKNNKQCNVAGTVGGAKDGRCNINGVCVATA